jgi:large-conductance mechanosensitive channel
MISTKPKPVPSDPIEYIYRENWITLTSIGSIFTFALIGSFREHVFDKMISYILPTESFEFMKVELPDIGNDEDTVIHFGVFIREAIIWTCMILVLYLMGLFVRWPNDGGITFNTVQRMST